MDLTPLELGSPLQVSPHIHTESTTCVSTITLTLDLFSIGVSLDDGALSNNTAEVVVINARSGDEETSKNAS